MRKKRDFSQLSRNHLATFAFLGVCIYAATFLIDRCLSDTAFSISSSIFCVSPQFVPKLVTSFYVTIFVLLTYYFVSLWIVRPQARNLSSEQIRNLFTAATFFQILMIWTRPVFSTDLYSYLAQGYLAHSLHINPYFLPLSTAAAQYPADPYLRKLISLGWDPPYHSSVFRYGPFWLRVEILIQILSQGSVRAGLFLFKTLSLASLLFSARMIWNLLKKFKPKIAVFGTFAFLWNPLVVFESVVDGHNDIVMVALMFFGIYLLMKKKEFVVANISLSLSILIKYLPLVVLLPLWRQIFFDPKLRSKFGKVICAFVGLFGLCMIVSYGRFWVGMQNFMGIYTESSRTYFSPLHLVFQISFVVCFAYSVWKSRTSADALKGMAFISIATVCFLSPSYHGWYYIIPASLLCLQYDLFCLMFLVICTVHDQMISSDYILRLLHSGAWMRYGLQFTVPGFILILSGLSFGLRNFLTRSVKSKLRAVLNLAS